MFKGVQTEYGETLRVQKVSEAWKALGEAYLYRFQHTYDGGIARWSSYTSLFNNNNNNNDNNNNNNNKATNMTFKNWKYFVNYRKRKKVQILQLLV